MKSRLNLRAFRPFPTGIARGRQLYLQMISYIVKPNSDVNVRKSLIKAHFAKVGSQNTTVIRACWCEPGIGSPSCSGHKFATSTHALYTQLSSVHLRSL